MARDDQLTPDERLDAIAEIFARGVWRWFLKTDRERRLGEASTRSGAADSDRGSDERAEQPSMEKGTK